MNTSVLQDRITKIRVWWEVKNIHQKNIPDFETRKVKTWSNIGFAGLFVGKNLLDKAVTIVLSHIWSMLLGQARRPPYTEFSYVIYIFIVRNFRLNITGCYTDNFKNIHILPFFSNFKIELVRARFDSPVLKQGANSTHNIFN